MEKKLRVRPTTAGGQREKSYRNEPVACCGCAVLWDHYSRRKKNWRNTTLFSTRKNDDLTRKARRKRNGLKVWNNYRDSSFRRTINRRCRAASNKLYDDANWYAPFALSLYLFYFSLTRTQYVFSLQPGKRLYPIIPSKLFIKARSIQEWKDRHAETMLLQTIVQ
jgi:hypothetical protein